MWGSSTQTLADRRDQANSRVFECSFQSCFNAVVDMTVPFDPEKSGQEYVLFLNDPGRNHLVVMGIPQSVNTTEVAVFFEPLAGDRVRVDVVSLSSRAQSTAAKHIFQELGKVFDRPGQEA
ncbi:MAG: hypothetical protein ACLFPX_04690 [Candidatus Omnitrophota bacterium]